MSSIDSLALTNGKIWTGDGFADEIVVHGNRIESIGRGAGACDRVLDLRGRLVVPGFIDNHVHFVTGGLQLSSVQLRDASTSAEFVNRIGARAKELDPGSWITGSGWDEQRWPDAPLPSRHWIDAVTPTHPVFVTRLDLHMGIANTLALKLAGITRETPDPRGGTIGRGDDGEPTGLLKDAAMTLVTSLVPPPSIDERTAAIRAGLAEAARCGVTSFCNMAIANEAFDDFRAFERLEREGELTARVWMYMPITAWERLRDSGVERPFGSDRLRIAGLKGFSDGSLGSTTAAFSEPYEGEPGNRGLLMKAMENGSMAEWIADADAHELQLAIHAIGDRANAAVLAIFESRPGHRGRRFRIEHAQHLDPSLIERFVESRVIASMQPYHAIDDGRWAEKKIGTRRAQHAFAWRSLLDAGAHVTFGSDWPVAPLDPITGIDAAVNRRTTDGRTPDGWIREQRITVEQALRCYTSSNAFAVFAENSIGTIAPGMRTDLAVLSHDLFTIPPEEIGKVRVEMTIFDGAVVYER